MPDDFRQRRAKLGSRAIDDRVTAGRLVEIGMGGLAPAGITQEQATWLTGQLRTAARVVGSAAAPMAGSVSSSASWVSPSRSLRGRRQPQMQPQRGGPVGSCTMASRVGDRPARYGEPLQEWHAQQAAPDTGKGNSRSSLTPKTAS